MVNYARVIPFLMGGWRKLRQNARMTLSDLLKGQNEICWRLLRPDFNYRLRSISRCTKTSCLEANGQPYKISQCSRGIFEVLLQIQMYIKSQHSSDSSGVLKHILCHFFWELFSLAACSRSRQRLGRSTAHQVHAANVLRPINM